MYSPGQYSRRRWHTKDKERNIVASLFSMIVVALMCTSLAEPRWFYMKGGGCSNSYIALYDFFYIGTFEYRPADTNNPTNGQAITDAMYRTSDKELKNCVTSQIVILLRFIIVFVILGALSSILAFCLDTVGSMQVILRVLRRNAIGSINTVIFCVTVIGLSYLAVTLMQHQQETTKRTKISKVEVKFDIGFYMVTAAGAIAILATAANLFKRYPSSNELAAAHLLDSFEGLETFSIGYPARVEVAPVQLMQAPPPYTP